MQFTKKNWFPWAMTESSRIYVDNLPDNHPWGIHESLKKEHYNYKIYYLKSDIQIMTNNQIKDKIHSYKFKIIKFPTSNLN